MREPHRGVRRVDALSAVSGGAGDIHPHVLRRNVDFNIVVNLRHHRDSRGGGMNAPSRFRLRNALHAVNAGFVLEPRICPLTIHGKRHKLHAAESGFLHILRGNLKAAPFRVVHIHPVELRGKERRLLAAGARPDFEDDVLVVVRILRQQQNSELLLKLLHGLLRGGQLLAEHLLHLRVGLSLQKLQRIADILFLLLILTERLHHRCKLVLLPAQRLKPLPIRGRFRRREFSCHILTAQTERRELILHRILHLFPFRNPCGLILRVPGLPGTDKTPCVLPS